MKRYCRGKSIIILIIALIIYSVLIAASYHHERLTGDATLYLSIAEKYMNGDFGNAINGYWGPLLSWLLIPFLYLGSSHLFAINAVNLILGVLTLTGVWRLSYRFTMTEYIRGFLLIPLIPITFFISLIQPMDFLLLCVLVYYLNIIFKNDYSERLSNGILGGLLGALAYFSKPYGFPFFISHFLLMNTMHFFKEISKQRRNKVLRNLMAGFLLFSLVSGTWIALISNKYGHITFSNMGRGVLASLGPGSVHETLEKGDPIFFEGFFEPPNDTAIVIYEDPSYAREKTWSPLESLSIFKHYLNNFTKNIFEGLHIYESFSRLSIAIMIAYVVLFFFQSINRLITKCEAIYPLFTVVLYTGGYMFFHFETRYLWIVNILLLLMGGHVLNVLFQHELFRSAIRKHFVTVVFILSFAITPLKSSFAMGQNSINREMHAFGTMLQNRYDIQGNIASNREWQHRATHDSWHKTFRLAYWLNSRYYGQAREDITDQELERELKRHDIDYYFIWGETQEIPDFLSRYKEITRGEIPKLKIYALKEIN